MLKNNKPARTSLNLSTITLRNLSSTDLEQVAGGDSRTETKVTNGGDCERKKAIAE